MGELGRDTCVGRRAKQPERVEAKVNRQKKQKWGQQELKCRMGTKFGDLFWIQY